MEGHTKVYELGREGDMPYHVVYVRDSDKAMSYYKCDQHGNNEWGGPLFKDQHDPSARLP